MSKKNVSSIEEQIEDWAKQYFNANHIQYLTKTESMDSEIDEALKTEESKQQDKAGHKLHQTGCTSSYELSRQKMHT